MDPLSVMASVAGLLTAAHEVVKLLGPYVSASRETPSIAAHVRNETESTRAVLIGLQTLVRELSGRVSPGGALVGLDQVVVILTGGVLLFAGLEGAVQGLVAAPSSPLSEGETINNTLGVWGFSSTQYRLPLRARMQWARRGESLELLLARLQGFKVSRARTALHRELPPSETALPTSDSILRSVFKFESNLETSRVYRRAQRDTMDFSFRSSIACTHAWSMLSGCSLADVSVLSVIALPLDLEDIANRHHYVDANDQQLTPIVEEKPSVLKSQPSLTEEGSIFHDCLKIHSQLLQIPGFQELFNTQWRTQWGEMGVTMGVIVQWEDDRERVWQQLDVFGALKSIFQEDVGYRLLTDELDLNLDKEVRQHSSRSAEASHTEARKVTYLFQLLCIDLGFSPDKLYYADGPLLEDNVCFLKVSSLSPSPKPNWLPRACGLWSLAFRYVSLRLADTGTISLVGEDDLDALVSSMKESSLLPDSAYKQTLEKFVDAQRLFVRDLLCLISALEKVARASPPLLVLDQPHITAPFLASYANSEIELLLTLERLLLAPPHLHIWAGAVHQWSITAETHCALIIREEKKAKRALRGALLTKWYDIRTVREYPTVVTSCLELSKPSQMFPRAAQFFQEIFGMLLGDYPSIEAISPDEKNDFDKG
ncbi:hypothetical protein CHU98_g4965 [Xylaria longipes]|nr:hypothetical protein CHU98_g4965 [Xylaria longipes]